MYSILNIKTHYSLLHSMIKIEDLIDFAKENNVKSLAITDDNLYGAFEFYKACNKNNIKPIIGLEINVLDLKIILYAKNYNGYKNLLKINTIRNKIEISKLLEYSEDIALVIPTESITLENELKKIFKDVFIESENLFFREILYLAKEDKNYLRYLHAIKKGALVANVIIKTDHYIEIEKYNQETNIKITEMCNLVIERNEDLLPKFKTPDNSDSFTYLKKLCKEGLKRIFGDIILKTYIERLKYELDIINKMGFSNYFLIVSDYVDYAKKNNILVGPGRGSAAGSLVSYCLNITTVDPIKYNLLFERFLNPERISMPDIDIDFEFNRREEVINYCISKYGKKHVAPIITFGTLAQKQVIRDIARTMEIDTKTTDKVIKNLNQNISLKENYKSNKELKSIIDKNQELTNMYKVAMKFEGLKRHTSIHAAGIVMSENPLDEIIPIEEKHGEFYITGYSMEHLEELGLLKMDFLGLKNLNLITETLKLVNINFDAIPLDNQKAIEIFTNVNTIGIFQFESAGMMRFLNKFRPNLFEDIFAALALFRPGPMDNIDTYIARKHGKEKIDYMHEDLEPVLKNTYGIIVYQEQIMQIANVMAGYSLGEADVLRKAMSKKKEEIMLLEKKKFIENSVKKGYEEQLAIKVFDYIFKFAAYGFNRAHSVAYALISYKMAYLKANYPKEFLVSLLNMSLGSEIKIKEYINECKKNNVKIIKPSVIDSTNKYEVINDGILFPLIEIKGITQNLVNKIIEERKMKPYKDVFDFISRIYGKNCNKKVLEALIYSGSLDCFNLNRKTLIENLDLLINYGDVIKDLDSEFALKPIINKVNEYEPQELIEKEIESMGLFLKEHPLTLIKIANNCTFNLCDIKNYFDKSIETYVVIDNYRETITKSANKMAFITISDEFDSGEAIIFPNAYFNVNIEKKAIYKLNGKVEKRYDKYQIIIDKLTQI